MPLPDAFIDRLEQIVPPARLAGVMASFATPQATAFRVNTLRATPETVMAELAADGFRLHRVAWKLDACWVAPEERTRLLETAAYREQRLYVQNLASMIPVVVLDPQPGERVLDLAAAPGSKTLQIACQMRGVGELAAVEVVKSRYYKLRDNLTAQGASNVRTYLRDGISVWHHRPEYFDRVLLDAPCSTEGRFRTDVPETFAYWSLYKIKEMVHKQQRLLFSAVQCLRPGGALVYATCAFAPEENEGVVSRILDRFGEALQVEPIGLDLDNLQLPLAAWQGRRFHPRLVEARRVLPDARMEAFFICKVRKVTSTL